MFKINFLVAFVLTVVSYVIFGRIQYQAPLSAMETTVIYAFWFGVSAIALWIFRRHREKP
jgi:F0F1-type ATP synthase assembly protein I